jgi:predicted N-acyltransferase
MVLCLPVNRRQYLNPLFFRLLKDRFRRNMCVIIASRAGQVRPRRVIAKSERPSVLGPPSHPPVMLEMSAKSDSWDLRQIVAGTVNVVKAGRFYGRYWGSFDFVKDLHFETCYYKAIEYCIDSGLEAMEPGKRAARATNMQLARGSGNHTCVTTTGDGSPSPRILSHPSCSGAGGDDFKFLRGFDPAVVNSVHYLVDPTFRGMVANFLEYERNEVSALDTLATPEALGVVSDEEACLQVGYQADVLMEKSAVRGHREPQGTTGPEESKEGA